MLVVYTRVVPVHGEFDNQLISYSVYKTAVKPVQDLFSTFQRLSPTSMVFNDISLLNAQLLQEILEHKPEVNVFSAAKAQARDVAANWPYRPLRRLRTIERDFALDYRTHVLQTMDPSVVCNYAAIASLSPDEIFKATDGQYVNAEKIIRAASKFWHLFMHYFEDDQRVEVQKMANQQPDLCFENFETESDSLQSIDGQYKRKRRNSPPDVTSQPGSDVFLSTEWSLEPTSSIVDYWENYIDHGLSL